MYVDDGGNGVWRTTKTLTTVANAHKIGSQEVIEREFYALALDTTDWPEITVDLRSIEWAVSIPNLPTSAEVDGKGVIPCSKVLDDIYVSGKDSFN